MTRPAIPGEFLFVAAAAALGALGATIGAVIALAWAEDGDPDEWYGKWTG
jgi:hypothetical protein